MEAKCEEPPWVDIQASDGLWISGVIAEPMKGTIPKLSFLGSKWLI